MANTKSALKAQRQAEKRAARNKSLRSAVRTYYKKAASALGETQETAAEAVLDAVRNLDRAAQKGIIHPNNAARRKSRLMSRLHALTVAETGEAVAAAPTAEAPKRKPAARKPAAASASRAVTHASAAARRASVTRAATAGTRRRTDANQ